MSEVLGKDKKEALKTLLKRLHQGESPTVIKQEFKAQFQDVSAEEISRLEEELIKEGLPPEELHRLCDIHLALFRESVEEEKNKLDLPAGHPLDILMSEHEIMLSMALELRDRAKTIFEHQGGEALQRNMPSFKKIKDHLRDSESHYLREENVLFPYLEKHGITQPPAIMWMEHDQIRNLKKSFYELLDQAENKDPAQFVSRLKEITFNLAEMLSNHFYKENNILFPTALKVFTPEEWPEVRSQFDELGYCCFTPQKEFVSSAQVQPQEKPESPGSPEAQQPLEAQGQPQTTRDEEGALNLETGVLFPQEIEAIFSTLPVDLTFVDKNDTVRFFSQTKERIFPRTKAVIGRNVQQCHPQKSVHLVNKILEEFKSGKRDEASFWIKLNGRLIYIRYFPVRDAAGNYLGCLEVTQDVTTIQKLEGEKRLL